MKNYISGQIYLNNYYGIHQKISRLLPLYEQYIIYLKFFIKKPHLSIDYEVFELFSETKFTYFPF